MLIEERLRLRPRRAWSRGGCCDPVPSACPSTSLRGADPGRYGTLRHPGDAYSFDIFNQALQAIRFPTRVAPLGELDTRYVIAEGFQRSIDKYFPQRTPEPPPSTTPLGIHGPLNAYLASGADDDARLADAFLIDGAAPATEPSHYRVPTLHHLDESAIRSAPTPDRPNHVTWEVVGAPHADRDSRAATTSSCRRPMNPNPSCPGTRSSAVGVTDRGLRAGPRACQEPSARPARRPGSLFPRRFTLTAALAALHQWLETGDPAPAAPRAERASPVPDDPTRTLLRDPDGNAIGGLRSPIIDVPAAAYHGEACISAGTTTPLSPERLAELYPTHQHYVEELRAATDTAVAGGLLFFLAATPRQSCG